MTKDWRWKLAILMFSLVPAYGIGKFIEHYQIQNSETEVAVTDFESKISESYRNFRSMDSKRKTCRSSKVASMNMQ